MIAAENFLSRPHIHARSKIQEPPFHDLVQQGIISPQMWVLDDAALKVIGTRVAEKLPEMMDSAAGEKKRYIKPETVAAAFGEIQNRTVALAKQICAETHAVTVNLLSPSPETADAVGNLARQTEADVMDLYDYFKTIQPDMDVGKATGCVGKVIQTALYATGHEVARDDAEKIKIRSSLPAHNLSRNIEARGVDSVHEMRNVVIKSYPSATEGHARGGDTLKLLVPFVAETELPVMEKVWLKGMLADFDRYIGNFCFSRTSESRYTHTPGEMVFTTAATRLEHLKEWLPELQKVVDKKVAAGDMDAADSRALVLKDLIPIAERYHEAQNKNSGGPCR